MDPTTAQKLRAMKSSKERSGFQFIYDLTFQLLLASACALLCSYSLWLPFAKRLIFASLPRVISHILSPNCLFVAVNVIVVALIVESRLGGSKKQSPIQDIHDEYVRRSDAIRKEVEVGGESVHGVIDEEKKMSKDTEKELGFKSETLECVNDGRDQEEDEDEDEELPNEELNRRIEDFIGRVNRQWWLEARLLMDFPVQHASRNITARG